MADNSYLTVKAILCGALLIFSVLLFPGSHNLYFQDASAQDLDNPREKKGGKEAKIDSETLNKRNQALSKKEAAADASSVVEDLRVVLELDSAPSTHEIEELARLGIAIEGERENLIQAMVPSTQLDILAKMDFIKYVRQPLYVVPALVSQGAFAIGANETNAAGFTGQGIKVAVIDIGFDLANPEIASNIVEAKSFRADGDIRTSDPRHGTAVAEIIVDVAPDVQLFLYNVDTDISLLNALDYILDQQSVQIVSMSLGIYNVGPLDGTSEISQSLDAIRNSGILFVTSAGNEAERHWKGDFVDSNSDGWNNFLDNDQTIGINAQMGQVVDVFLSWDDWPTSTQDFDLYVFDDALNLVAFSENPQVLGYFPKEQARFVAGNTGTYHIGIFKFSATQDVTFDLFTYPVDLNEHNVPSGSLIIPADSAGAFTVGAAFWEDGELEPFSSRGPTSDGRMKPDIVGPDGVTTSTLNPFLGSSAATPYVSGAAALVKDVYPGADSNTVQSLLEENTLNNHVKNNDDGTGMVYMSFLLAGIPVANAGGNQTVNENSTVTLNGTLSTDADGTIVSYLWEQVNGTIAVNLTNASSATALFTAPSVTADVELVFKLTVTDDLGASGSDTATIIVENINQPPIADAGLNQVVDEGTIVTLNGTASSDPDGDILSYLWVQTNGTSVELDDPTSAAPSFLAPEVGTDGDILTFELTVSDGAANSTDTVDIIVQNVNQAPIADAGADQTVEEGDIVTLNGAGSSDPDGDALTFSWIQTAGSIITLSGADTATPPFTAPQVDSAGATLTFELTVEDGNGGTATDTVDIMVNNVLVPPIANAGPDETVNEGTLVTLNGTGSTDPDGTIQSYSWTQINGTSVQLADADTASPSFTAPEVDSTGAVLTFELTVSDNDGLTSIDTVSVVVQNVNQVPVADAGSDQVADEGTIVVLDGTGSSDPDGDALTFSWIQTVGPTVLLSGADTATPSFTAPEVGIDGETLTFELTVDDGNGGAATDFVNIIVQNVNQPPIANAGPDQTVNEGTVVTLDGTGSSDPDGDPLTHSWVQTDGTLVVLSDPTSATPSFTALEVDSSGSILTFELTVTDNDGLTDTDTVVIIVENVNKAPVADAGPDQTVDEGSPVTLDGTASSDPDGDDLTYSWVQIAGPAVTLSGIETVAPSFTAPEVSAPGASLTFELTVSDGIVNSTDSVDVIVQNVNQAPVSDAGLDQVVDEGAIVLLEGTGSTDPDGDALTFSWVQIAGPEVSLDGSTSATPSFTAPAVDSAGAVLTFELTVDDGNGGNATDTVDIIVNDVSVNQEPVADAGLDQTVNEDTIVTLNGTGSSDPDGDTLTYSWTQINGTSVELTGADTATPSFTTPEVDSAGATLTFVLTVTDNDGLTSTDNVIVIVQNVNQPPIANAGPDQTVEEGDFVMLNGTASSDADGDPLIYSWVQSSGPSITLLGADTATPSFTAPLVDSLGATLTFQLTVEDGSGGSSTDTVDMIVNNVPVPPIANAGSDQVADEGTLVTLDGTGSSDPDGTIQSYSWLQINGIAVTLDDPSSVTPSFTAPEVGADGDILMFELTVSDNDGLTSTDSVSVVVQNVNQLPLADAGADQIVEEGDVVTLNGAGSSDPDGDLLTYSWVQIAGPNLELLDSGTATPSFTAPEVDPAGAVLTFELTVDDGNGGTSANSVDVIVQNVNQLPIADAGLDQVVDEGTIVVLDGTGSSDPDGDSLTFSWIQTSGPAVLLSGADTATPSFTAPDVNSTGAVLTFEITVSDGTAVSIDTVNISIQNVNKPPVANAGLNQTVDEGDLVDLDGSGTLDPDGDAITYSWMQTAGPAVTLSDTTSATPSFTAPEVGSSGATLTFELTVTDSFGLSSTDTVNVIVQDINQPPMADAGSDQVVDEGASVTLNGTDSSDPDGDILSYSWIQTDGPAVELLDSDTAMPSFIAPAVDSDGAILTFELTVSDPNGGNATDTVDIIVNDVSVNQPPVADAGLDQVVEEGSVVALNGTASSDPDGDTLSNSWVQTDGTLVVLSDPTSPTPSFTAPEVDSAGATLTFELTVSDGLANSTDTVNITINNVEVNQQPVADAGSDQTVTEGTAVTLDGTDSSDPDGDVLTFSWVQIAGPEVSLNDPTLATPSFTAPLVDSARALITFQLTVDDGNGGNAIDTVDVVMNNVLVLPIANAGSGQTIDEGALAILDGTDSSDPDGDILSYSWVQTNGTSVELDDPTSPTPSFTATEVDTAGAVLTFELTVTDNDGLTSTDTVDIIVENVNVPPVADAGSDQMVNEGALVTLNGTGSSDPDGDILSYSWIRINRTSVELTEADTATPSFIAPEVDSLGATLIFELTVTDNDGLTSTDTVAVIIQNLNQPPIADAGSDQVVDEGMVATLNGTASSDPDGDVLSYLWVQTAGPAVIISNTASAAPSFAAPQVNSTGVTLTFELTVSDNDGLTSTDSVDVIVQNINQPPVADAGPDQTLNEGTVVTLDGTGSTDPDGIIVSYFWQQESGPLVSLSNTSAASTTFLAPLVDANTILTFRLNVTDNDNSSATDTVVITVNNVVVASSTGGGGGGGGGSQAPAESTISPATFFALNPLAKIIMYNTLLLDWRGVSILEASEGQQVQVSSRLINQQQLPQNYVYIVQITDDSGFTVEIISQNETAAAGYMVQVGTSWTPPATGIYNIDIFVWDSLSGTPVPLSNVGHRTITVI